MESEHGSTYQTGSASPFPPSRPSFSTPRFQLKAPSSPPPPPQSCQSPTFMGTVNGSAQGGAAQPWYVPPVKDGAAVSALEGGAWTTLPVPPPVAVTKGGFEEVWSSPGSVQGGEVFQYPVPGKRRRRKSRRTGDELRAIATCVNL
ncbi:hypothetical protein HDU67_008732 [Dinochytrium kinnereticum]|nr:hypothetical protein HDU67_008732 [Dinochytrium kinnereticum]